MELGKAKVVKEGRDVTIIANQLMRVQAQEAMKTLEAEGISVELIDPLTIKPYDKETMVTSVNKTGRALIITESRQTGSYAAEFGFALSETCHKNLKKPVKRLCTLDLPIPKGVEESYILPGVEDIVSTVRDLMA
jgi:pyruvate dehydrogenase E1 component beta subunit